MEPFKCSGGWIARWWLSQDEHNAVSLSKPILTLRLKCIERFVLVAVVLWNNPKAKPIASRAKRHFTRLADDPRKRKDATVLPSSLGNSRLIHDQGIGEKLEEDSGKAPIPQRGYTGLIHIVLSG
jgi:hypothetical protein